MRFCLHILFLLAVSVLSQLHAQELPPIESFEPNVYDADNQNWDLSQSLEKIIYVANKKGLLEYNGANWNLYKTPNQTVMRSVHVVQDRIYTGCYMEFGYWKKDSLGILRYYSLSEKLTDIVEDEEFWKIINVKQWVLFQSLDRIYVYDTVTSLFSIVEPKSSIVKMYSIGDEVYFQDFNHGIFKIENGKANLLINNPNIINSRVVNMFDYDEGMLIVTARQGLYIYNNSEVYKWNTSAQEELNGVSIYSAEKFDDSTLLLGTISNGLIAFDFQGNLMYHINQSKGLQNNTVLSIFEDIDKNIWLGLDNGLNFINSYSPYRIYNDYSGKIGTVYCSKIFENNIYLGTNQGLFVKPIDNSEDFKIISGTNGQVWNLNEISGELFCGHDNGTYIVKKNQAQKIADVQGTWGLKAISGKTNLILQGNYDGLNILEKKDNNWVFRNKIDGFDISSRYFDFLNTKTVFVSHEYKGVFKLELDDSFTSVIKIDRQEQFEKGLNSSLLKFNGDIFYANNNGVYKYNLKQNTFKKDSVVSQLYDKDDYISGKLIQDKTNKLWNFSKYNLSYLDSGSLSNIPELITIALPDKQVNNMNGYENITHLFNEEYLIGTSNGYMIIDLSKIKSNNYSISLNGVEVGNLGDNLKKVTLNEAGIFTNKTNNINFSFSIPEYIRYSEKRYQYKLEGYNNIWSEWTTNSSQLFENLPQGHYTFKVRGRVGNVITKNNSSYSFTIEKPWYLSDTFIGIYIIGGLLMLITVHLIYRSYYKKQRVKLLEDTQKDLELKELENKQQATDFKNETLLQDIESKNRELAISTMSLIKKNEFLGNIKDELKKVNTDKKLNSVIKIIDRNINNSNDWEFFEKAFNNADKDFLKKVKNKHPSLTSNDLRLCAYLRLNLSSKEIAPLLNISVRSVEVKRYRLRKKMNLDHDIGLTNYILEL